MIFIRGFAVCVPGFESEKVKNQLLQYPRRLLFSDMEFLMHGLARIMSYDFACRAKNPKYILGSYDMAQKSAEVKEERKAMILGGEINPKSDYLDLSIIRSDKYPPKYIFDMLNKAKSVTKQINEKEKTPITVQPIRKDTNYYRLSKQERQQIQKRKTEAKEKISLLSVHPQVQLLQLFLEIVVIA